MLNAGLSVMMRPGRRYLTWLALAVVTMSASLLAMLLLEYRTAERRREAVAAVTALGGVTHYNWQLKNKMGPSELKDVVRDLSGNPALFAYVEHVDLTGSRFIDDDLVLLEPFGKAKWIVIGDAQVSDEGMDSLSRKLPRCRIRR